MQPDFGLEKTRKGIHRHGFAEEKGNGGRRCDADACPQEEKVEKMDHFGSSAGAYCRCGDPIVLCHLFHDLESFPVIEAFRNLLIIDNQHSGNEEQYAEKYADKKDAAVQLIKIRPLLTAHISPCLLYTSRCVYETDP